MQVVRIVSTMISKDDSLIVVLGAVEGHHATLRVPVGDVIELTEERRYFGGEEIKPHRRRFVSKWMSDGD